MTGHCDEAGQLALEKDHGFKRADTRGINVSSVV
jgi:hypothetical protein